MKNTLLLVILSLFLVDCAVLTAETRDTTKFTNAVMIFANENKPLEFSSDQNIESDTPTETKVDQCDEYKQFANEIRKFIDALEFVMDQRNKYFEFPILVPLAGEPSESTPSADSQPVVSTKRDEYTTSCTPHTVDLWNGYTNCHQNYINTKDNTSSTYSESLECLASKSADSIYQCLIVPDASNVTAGACLLGCSVGIEALTAGKAFEWATRMGNNFDDGACTSLECVNVEDGSCIRRRSRETYNSWDGTPGGTTFVLNDLPLAFDIETKGEKIYGYNVIIPSSNLNQLGYPCLAHLPWDKTLDAVNIYDSIVAKRQISQHKWVGVVGSKRNTNMESINIHRFV